MKLLLIGSGAREHALAWKLAKEPQVDAILCAPGNIGIAQHARCAPVDVADPNAILQLAIREAVDFTIIGPELPLANGVANVFTASGRALFGPSRTAARLESSKAFAKMFMARHGIPTASFRVCHSVDEALAAVAGDTFGFPVVVKADGLAAGKGVTLPRNPRFAPLWWTAGLATLALWSLSRSVLLAKRPRFSCFAMGAAV